MKNINLTVDSVLNNLFSSLYADGKGNITIVTTSNEMTPYFLINMALENLGIQFKTDEYIDDDNNVDTYFEFKLSDIENIQDDCPIFYKKIKELNFSNSKSGIRKNKIDQINKK
jgi:hypothetical protein